MSSIKKMSQSAWRKACENNDYTVLAAQDQPKCQEGTIFLVEKSSTGERLEILVKGLYI